MSAPATQPSEQAFRRRLRWRHGKSKLFASLTITATLVGLATLAALLVNVFTNARLLIAMNATAEAGFAFSLRSLERGHDLFPYIRISQVTEGSSAEQLGVRSGDALIRMGFHAVAKISDAWATVEQIPEGPTPIGWVAGAERLLGDLRAEIDPETSRVTAVLLDYLTPGSAAERAGLQVNDILRKADDFPIQGTRQAWEAIVIAAQQKPTPSSVILEIQRGEQILHIALEAEQQAQIPLNRSFWHTLWFFITEYESPRFAELSGLRSAILGSFYVIGLMALFSVPLGVGAAIYLEEYARRTWLTGLIQVLISNLAGVPSVIYGIIGLEIFARAFALERGVLAGALTMALLILPVVIIASREALRAIPDSIRQAAYAVGATRWQVVRHHVLPYAAPGIFTGVVLSLSRAIGEAAPLILLGAFQYVAFDPKGLKDPFTVLPIQIFTWVGMPQEGRANIAAAAILVLLVILLLMNALAIFLRIKFQKRW
ncbi:phosphate ABC transporter permease PstA [Candidatus Acetothermia bacterium]|jgi:phosphate transport system permease protein|nr:phosphate ABC transporter permease PstA [Candidatus Acetothermia bacterium]MCI2432062.1 phosphate ABC transporter permease PstA [Candidatus Acetothermia bacterium]MCI2435727.1 phosphate ABC transporter permease PstA [Candidatus Acetothermia bacterium]